MSNGPVFYHQPCPVCGRVVRVRVVLLGRRVYCEHCGGGFLAADSSMGGPMAGDDGAGDVMQRAERLLAEAARNTEAGELLSDVHPG